MTTQAEQKIFEKIGIEPDKRCPYNQIKILCECVDITPEINIKEYISNCEGCSSFCWSYPIITSEIREKIEEIIYKNRIDIKPRHPKHNNNGMWLYFSDEEINIRGIAETRSDALCNLVIQLPEIWEEVKEIFK